jgi:hypothetical protein
MIREFDETALLSKTLAKLEVTIGKPDLWDYLETFGAILILCIDESFFWLFTIIAILRPSSYAYEKIPFGLMYSAILIFFDPHIHAQVQPQIIQKEVHINVTIGGNMRRKVQGLSTQLVTRGGFTKVPVKVCGFSPTNSPPCVKEECVIEAI